MNNEIKTWLFDILQSISEIDSYYKDKPRTFESYQNDIKTKRAIERNLEIIGEAVNRIRKSDKAIPLNNADNIVATRNRIIHGYDNISDDLIWSIVINKLPKLKENVKKLLEEST